MATLESNSDEATPEKVDKEKENTYVTDGKINSPVGAKKKSTSRIGPRCMKTCEALMLTLVIVIIVGAFTIPTVLYALPSAEDEASHLVLLGVRYFKMLVDHANKLPN